MKYYLSDLYLGHGNVIDYCKRPFSSVEEMNEALVSRWNSRVKDNDTVYFLGDLAFGAECENLISRLKGKKILIVGNHDTFINKLDCEKYFEKVSYMEQFSENGFRFTLCHYPLLEWNGSRREEGDKYYGYMLHGHIHNNVKEEYRFLYEKPNTLNVGADVNGFTPVTFDELLENNAAFKARALELLDEEKGGERLKFTRFDYKLKKALFDAVSNGEVDYIVLLNDGINKYIAKGDLLKLSSFGQSIWAAVTDVDVFSSSKEITEGAEAVYNEEVYGVLRVGIRKLPV